MTIDVHPDNIPQLEEIGDVHTGDYIRTGLCVVFLDCNREHQNALRGDQIAVTDDGLRLIRGAK